MQLGIILSSAYQIFGGYSRLLWVKILPFIMRKEVIPLENLVNRAKNCTKIFFLFFHQKTYDDVLILRTLVMHFQQVPTT